MKSDFPTYRIGQIVHHQKFDYRGVIVQVDPSYRGSEAWYESVAKSRPPRSSPWYHVLVEKADHITYVAERHLVSARDDSPVDHPLISYYFDRYDEGIYLRMQPSHSEVKEFRL